jgi:hypothetical protein
MDEKIQKIISAKLKLWHGQPIDVPKLEKIRDEVYKKTRTNKFAPFSNIKKWIKMTRQAMAKEEKAKGKPAKHAKAAHIPKKGKAKPAPHRHEPAHERIPEPAPVSARVEASVNELKDEVQRIEVAASARPAQIVFDKVYLQRFSYEIASMRQAMERISRQLDKLEKELLSHRDD